VDDEPEVLPDPTGFQLFVLLDPEMHDRLQERAWQEGRTLAGVTRRALHRYLRSSTRRSA
jgi:hypothetical protein